MGGDGKGVYKKDDVVGSSSDDGSNSDDSSSSDDVSSEEEEVEEAVPQMGDAACEALFEDLKAHVKILIAEFPTLTELNVLQAAAIYSATQCGAKWEVSAVLLLSSMAHAASSLAHTL